MDRNPFEPPRAPIGHIEPVTDPGTYYVDGKSVVVSNGVSFPRRCVFCNKDEDESRGGRRIGKDLYYVPVYVYFLLLLNVIFLLIGYFVARKPVFVMYSICGEHRRRKRRNVILCLLSLAIMVISFVVGGVAEIPGLFALAAIGFLSFLVFALKANKGLVPNKRKDQRFWIKGFGKEFLSHLGPTPNI